MKKVILILCVLMAASLSFSDDGGSYYPEDWTYGNIYVDEPNEKIALERELLLVNQAGGEVEARFGFRNTTGGNVVVPCAFPVVIMLPFFPCDDENSVSTLVTFNAEPRLTVWEFLLKKKVEQTWSCGEYGGNVTMDEVFALDEKLRTVSRADFLSELSRFGGSDPTLLPCEIEQDGRRVPVKMVGIETSIGGEYKSPLPSYEYGEKTYVLRLVLHFYHELSFRPNAASHLVVKYRTETEKHAYHGRQFRLLYDISTGGTWKDAEIGEFLVLTDGQMDAKMSRTTFEENGFVVGSLYAAKKYRPQSREYFEFTEFTGGDDSAYFNVLDCYGDEKRQPFVKDVRASSFLKGTYKIAGKSRAGFDEAANLDANMRGSDYSPGTSFDGNFYNGWVEGARGEGIGEWIEFTLGSHALGPFATNGLRRFSWRRFDNPESSDDKYYDFDWSRCGAEYSLLARAGGVGGTWLSNNRVESMAISGSDGKRLATLQFADLFPEFVNGWTSDRIALNAVRNPLFLERGTYRMTIEDVYKGSRWDDTVLGEVWFVPVGDVAGGFLKDDADGFFREKLEGMVRDYVGGIVSRSEDEMRENEEKFAR